MINTLTTQYREMNIEFDMIFGIVRYSNSIDMDMDMDMDVDMDKERELL